MNWPDEDKDIYSILAALEATSMEMQGLKEERDEARRMVCRLTSELESKAHILITPETVAEEYGWDCFTESNND